MSVTLQMLKHIQPIERFVVVGNTGSTKAICNTDALTATDADAAICIDPYAIAAALATTYAAVIPIFPSQGLNSIFLYPTWGYTAAVSAMTTSPRIAVFGLAAPDDTVLRANAISSTNFPATTDTTLVGDTTQNDNTVKGREWFRMLDIDGNVDISWSNLNSVCNNHAGSAKSHEGIPIRVPVFGARCILVSITTIGAVSNGSMAIGVRAAG